MLANHENPVAEADELGTMVYTTDDFPVYLLIQLNEQDGKIGIKVNSEGMNKEQSIAALQATIELLTADLSEASYTAV